MMLTKYKVLVLVLSIGALSLKAAGAQCSVCRDATSGSAPQARAGLRRAIPVLGIPALLIFGGILVLALRRGTLPEDREHTVHEPKVSGR